MREYRLFCQKVIENDTLYNFYQQKLPKTNCWHIYCTYVSVFKRANSFDDKYNTRVYSGKRASLIIKKIIYDVNTVKIN